MRFEYLLLMAACLAVTLPLEFWLRARVYRRPLRLLLAIVPALVVFYVWDAVAIARGHWTYSPAHTTGWLLPGAVPVEEVVFFIVIPICGLLTYEGVGTVLHRRAVRKPAEEGPSPLLPGPPKRKGTVPFHSGADQKGTVPFRSGEGR
ncbi:MAG: lycopene cyclase domain-containing protein [Actinobacteria bacterium]|nr:lycopene cyclase domain-containing protein [Actinomycetota bacterium]